MRRYILENKLAFYLAIIFLAVGCGDLILDAVPSNSGESIIDADRPTCDTESAICAIRLPNFFTESDFSSKSLLLDSFQITETEVLEVLLEDLIEREELLQSEEIENSKSETYIDLLTTSHSKNLVFHIIESTSSHPVTAQLLGVREGKGVADYIYPSEASINTADIYRYLAAFAYDKKLVGFKFQGESFVNDVTDTLVGIAGSNYTYRYIE